MDITLDGPHTIVEVNGQKVTTTPKASQFPLRS